MNIGLLACDDVPQRMRHIAGGYQDMFDALLRPHVPDLAFTRFDSCKGALPGSPDECDAYLCTGSRFSVYDELEWIGALKSFVKNVHDAGKPYVGICFGHQMLAQALGGHVAKAEQGWGIGVLDMDIIQPESWMQPPLGRCKLQYMHGDQVQRLPERSTVLAAAAHCPVAMFKVGETMLGIEGHPEFPAAYQEALLRARRDVIGAEHVDRALATLEIRTDQIVAGKWIANFIESASGRGTPVLSRRSA